MQLRQEQSKNKSGGVSLSLSLFSYLAILAPNSPRFQKLARRVVEAVDRACSISSLFSRSSHSSTRQLPVRPTTGSRVSLSLSFSPRSLPPTFPPIRFTSFWFWCRCTGEKGKKRRRGMTKRLPAAPLVDSDHDSRAAADHRALIGRILRRSLFGFVLRNGQTSPRDRCYLQCRSTRIRDRFARLFLRKRPYQSFIVMQRYLFSQFFHPRRNISNSGEIYCIIDSQLQCNRKYV